MLPCKGEPLLPPQPRTSASAPLICMSPFGPEPRPRPRPRPPGLPFHRLDPQPDLKSQASSSSGQPTPVPPGSGPWGLASHLNIKGELSQSSVPAALEDSKAHFSRTPQSSVRVVRTVGRQCPLPTPRGKSDADAIPGWKQSAA